MPTPKTHTLSLYKNTPTQGSTTGSLVKTQSLVQTIQGSLQMARVMEGNAFDKQTVKADFAFYFDAALLLTANVAELKESAIMKYTDPTSATITLQITGVDDSYAAGPHYNFYKVLLLEIK